MKQTTEQLQYLFNAEALALKAKGVPVVSGRYIADKLRFERPPFLTTPLKMGNNNVKTLVSNAVKQYPSLKGFFTSHAD